MNLVILFVVICLAVYAVNWAANLYYDDPYDVDELEKQIQDEEDSHKNENQV